MSFRGVMKLVCGLAGGSAVLAAMAESKGYSFEKTKHNGSSRKWTGLDVLQAAVPQTCSPGHDRTVTASGNGWDSNWDKTEHRDGEQQTQSHIFLIRHSQDNLNGSVDKERDLTRLGREQAEYTGQRLAALGLKYDVMAHSTTTHATETANIINKHLPVSCDLLREGAPIEPVPPITWKPDCVVSVMRLGLNNGSITWITIRPSGRVGFRMMGNSGFMTPETRPYLTLLHHYWLTPCNLTSCCHII
ncbi:unnamed protein product [Coregonus sp. 'balchen']|nr:unnamed protein product [Coregonus sp. 'balchen']